VDEERGRRKGTPGDEERGHRTKKGDTDRTKKGDTVHFTCFFRSNQDNWAKKGTQLIFLARLMAWLRYPWNASRFIF
jgi:hypothetical protein